MSKPVISIIVPTFNNAEYLNPCVMSIQRSGVLNGLAELIIVNNGDAPLTEQFKGLRNIRVIDTGKNLGWEGGLQAGLKVSDAPFVCFQNDDTLLIPPCSLLYQRMLINFHDPLVAAVGPSTTVAAGWHSIYRPDPIIHTHEVPFLIFFTVMIRRADLDAVGGVDNTLPGGDDLDLSMRFRLAGKKVILEPSAFLIHHGFKTGERVHGGPNNVGGWNSKQMSERTNMALIKKHGFRNFFETMNGQVKLYGHDVSIPEHELIRNVVMVDKSEKIVELGCGGLKVFPQSIGVDRVKTGTDIPNLHDTKSVATVIADVSQPLPFEDGEFDIVIAQHIIEHCVDTIEVLKEWTRILKPGGRLILSTPNEHMTSGIPLNPEHCHAFTPDSLGKILSLLGVKELSTLDPKNGISFIGIYEKQNVMEVASV